MLTEMQLNEDSNRETLLRVIENNQRDKFFACTQPLGFVKVSEFGFDISSESVYDLLCEYYQSRPLPEEIFRKILKELQAKLTIAYNQRGNMHRRGEC